MKFFNDIRDALLLPSPAAVSEGIRNDGRREERLVSQTLKGHVWNPMRKYPRNKGCFCGSGAKAKKCCLPDIRAACSEKFADYIDSNWEKLLSGQMTLPRSPGHP
jgi:hypothetical protein